MPPFWTYSAGLWLGVLGWIFYAAEYGRDAKRIGELIDGKDQKLYTRTTQGILRALGRMMRPQTSADHPLPSTGILARLDWRTTSRAVNEADVTRLQANPWSWPVLDMALRLAVFYPLFLALTQWVATGQPTGIGAAELFGDEPRDWLRYATFGLIALMMVSTWLFYSAFAGAFAGAFAVAGVAFVSFQCQRARGIFGYGLILLILLASLLMIALTVGFPENNPVIASVFLFLGIFPILNAVFDWVSYGLTIWLIRAGFRGNSLIRLACGLTDIAAAEIMFMGLAATLVAVVGGLNAVLPQPMFDLAAFFDALEFTPLSQFWVIGMVFSTLLPTLVHLVIVVLSAITLPPQKLRDWIRNAIAGRREGGQDFLLASLVISAIWTAYALLMSVGLLSLGLWLWSLSGEIGLWYLGQMRL